MLTVDRLPSAEDVYTVLAPSNAAFERVKLTPGFSDRSHIVTVLRNHILLGQVVTEERLKQLKDGDMFTVPTLLGTQAVFANHNGQWDDQPAAASLGDVVCVWGGGVKWWRVKK